jgi:hypothetical protein
MLHGGNLTLAGCCCAHLLQDAGVRLTRGVRRPVPAIVVSQSTQALIEDVFQQPGIFAGLPPIDRRIVAWGRDADPVMLPHSAVLISDDGLTARLQPAYYEDSGDSGWTIHTTQSPSQYHHFGSRKAFAAPVEVSASACWVESLANGWLFLIPGFLIAVGAPPDILLADSRLVAPQLRGHVGESAEFPAWPRIADPLCAPGWLACGSAAMAFDPICGDGTGNAMREAILAAAVVRAARRGEPVEALLAHYRARLIAGFRRHLGMALEFYRAGNSGPWWDEEIRATECGIAWCSAELAGEQGFRYRLNGFDLESVSG